MLGCPDDAAAAGDGTVIAILKYIRSQLVAPIVVSGAVTIADGADVAEGATTDAEAAAGNGTVTAILKRLRTLLNGGLPAALGRAAMAASLPVVLSTEQMPDDSAAFNPSSDPYMPVGGEFDDAGPAGLAEGQGGIVRMSSRREFYTTVRDAAGNERGVNVDTNNRMEVAPFVADGADIALGTTTDAAASSVVAEDATARTSIGLWKGIKNILILMNAKFAALGQAAMAASMPVVIASDQSSLPVNGSSDTVVVIPTITAGAYAVNDSVGAIQALTGAARTSDKETVLQSLVITDLAMQDVDFKIFFFNQNPSNGTYTDNIELGIHDTDMGFCVGVLEVLASDYVDAKDNSVARKVNIGLGMTPSGSANLYAIAKTTDTPTYATTGDLTFKYFFLQD